MALVYHFLMQVMKQKDDFALFQLLQCVRINSCTTDDVAILRSCEIGADNANYPIQALHVYRLSVNVDKRNTHVR